MHTEQILRASNFYLSVLILTSSSGLTRYFVSSIFEMLYLEQDNQNLLFFNPLERKTILNIFMYLDVGFGLDHLEGNVVISKMMPAKESFLAMFHILID